MNIETSKEEKLKKILRSQMRLKSDAKFGTYRKAAKAMDINYTTYHKYLIGTRNIKFEHLIKIMVTLDITFYSNTQNL